MTEPKGLKQQRDIEKKANREKERGTARIQAYLGTFRKILEYREKEKRSTRLSETFALAPSK